MFPWKQTTFQLCIENGGEDFKLEQIHIDGICINGKC